MQKRKPEFHFIKQKKTLSKTLIRLRKIHLKSTYSFNTYFKKIISFFRTKQKSKKIYIRLTQNNIFCTLTTNSCKTLLVRSSGKYKIKTSKKKIKFSSKIVLTSFLKEVKPKVLLNKVLINIIAPKNLRKKIINQISQSFAHKYVYIDVSEKKAFNGCKPKKQKRKKRKGLRIFA